MFDHLHTVVRATLVAATLSVGALAVPVYAEGPEAGFVFDGKHDDYECQSVEKAIRSLKKQKYKNLEFSKEYTKEEVYFFYATQKNRKGEVIPYHLYYDSCEREVISKQSQI